MDTIIKKIEEMHTKLSLLSDEDKNTFAKDSEQTIAEIINFLEQMDKLIDVYEPLQDNIDKINTENQKEYDISKKLFPYYWYLSQTSDTNMD